MNRSDCIANLAAALAKAQSEFPPIPRSKNVKVTSKRTGQTYTFKYAPFEDILRATKDARVSNGLAFVQSATGELMETTILHKSGEWITSTVPMIRGYQGLQEMGSELTYVSRYGFCKAFGIQADDDDDGNAADGNHVEEKKPVSRITAKGSLEDEYNKLDEVEKKWLNDLAGSIADWVAEGKPKEAMEELDAAIPYIPRKDTKDAEYKQAIQHLLPTNVMKAIKEVRQQLKEAA